MNQQFRHRQFPAGNPLANVLVVVAGIIIISLSLALGFIVFVGIAGFMLVMAIVVSVRAWWLKRRFFARSGNETTGKSANPQTHRIIEGEYHEVRTKRTDPGDHDSL